MSYVLRYAARTHPGLIRDRNEDSYYVGDRLIVVADGMGGHAAGEVASAITAEHFAQIDQSALTADLYEPLENAIAESNRAIAEAIEKDPSLAGMGTTATAILFGRHRITVANVGDSRAYLYQRDRDTLTQLTSDDSLVQMLVDTGAITPDEARHHPYRSAILKSVNGTEVQPRFTSLVRVFGDRYLVCSDGLTDYVDLLEIQLALAADDIDACADRLVQLALDAGAPDNVTVVLADIVRDLESADVEDGADPEVTGTAHRPPTEPIRVPSAG